MAIIEKEDYIFDVDIEKTKEYYRIPTKHFRIRSGGSLWNTQICILISETD